VADLEEELDRLYGLPLDEFTPARNELAKRLKGEGDGDAASAVKSLKKPTVSAGLVNQLARREPELVQRLLAAGEELRKAQERVLGGGGAEELRRASDAEREAVRGLVHAARGLGAGQAVLDRVEQSLRAAASDEDARALLERGRFTSDFERSGFPAIAAAPRDELADRRRQRRDEQAQRIRGLQARLRELERKEARAQQAVRKAEEQVARARETAERAEEARAEAERVAAELTADVEQVQAELADAEG
jgi:hypothetical protein